ncbi:MAG: hypothetical protein ABIH78_03865 [Candidatus Peregrinibacteria bacterium]
MALFEKTRAKLRKVGETVSPANVVGKLSSPEKAAKFGTARLTEALKEMQRPIGSIIAGVRGELSAVLLDLPKKVIKKTLSTITKILTGVVALPANIARGTANIALQVPLTAALGIASVVPEKTFGTVSRAAQATKEKILKAIGEEEEPQELPKAA